jgi:predicted SAM-dependent methyltransferase
MLRPVNRWLDPRRWARRAKRMARGATGQPPGRSRWLRDAPMAGEIRIQVGAGGTNLPGWLNTDIDGSADYYLDATQPWPVRAGSVAYVFSDNMIEHLTLDQGRAFLQAAHDALAPGGWIRIVTPDPEGVSRAYLLDDPAADAMIERHRRAGYRIEHRVDLLRSIYHENSHTEGYLYDEAALRAELAAVGFRTIRRASLGHSEVPVLSGLDARTESGDQSLLLAIEAQA